MNNTSLIQSRRAAAQEIMLVANFIDSEPGLDAKKETLAHWDLFVGYFMPAPSDHENDVAEWVDDRFNTLYRHATQWVITDLMARIEALENPNSE
jgi:hypothetical protein